MNKILIGSFFVLIIGIFIIGISSNINEKDTKKNVENNKIKITKDGTRYIVNPVDIQGGGPGKGGIGVDKGIPALDERNIKFVSVFEADKWIEDDELVLALEYKGVERVYPLQILVWHEIVNDIVAGNPLLITYCPLCGSGIAYERKISIEGKKVETKFGTSGKLYNSNLIMYDEKTDTYWQQIDGRAIVGELTGQELKAISLDTVVWEDWKRKHPNAEVLSQETGINRDYGKDPYGNYYKDSFLFFPVENQDNKIHPKEIIFGIEIDGTYKVYREEDLKKEGVIKDKVNGINVGVKRSEDGKVVVKNIDSGEEIVKERGFWFAWYAFHPKTEVYGIK